MREYFFIAVVAAVLTYGTTPGVRRLAVLLGAATPVRARDVHTHPIPRLGGVAMLVGFLGAVLVASRLEHLSGIFESLEIRGVVIGAVLVTLVGAIDDVRELDWLTKLAGQIIAAGAMAFFGVQLLSVPLFGVTVLPGPVLVGLTVLIVLVTTNAVNFIDGLDGLAAGLVAIAAVAFFIYSYLISASYAPPNVFSSATFVSAALAGACLGFLPHNVFPAKLFMGDSGALTLGLLLAAATILNVGQINPAQVSQLGANQLAATVLPLLIPISIMMLPLVDVLWAVVRRTARGQRPWQADSQHLHHRMLKIGHGHRRAVLLLWLWAVVVAMGSVSFVVLPWYVAAGGGVVMLALAAGLTAWLPRFSAPGHRPKEYDTKGRRLDA